MNVVQKMFLFSLICFVGQTTFGIDVVGEKEKIYKRRLGEVLDTLFEKGILSKEDKDNILNYEYYYDQYEIRDLLFNEIDDYVEDF